MIRWVWMLLVLALLPMRAQAVAALDYDAFGTIPVVHDGRVKPLDSVARIYLYRLCGCTQWDGQSPSAWLAASLFRPDQALGARVVQIEDAPLVAALGLDEADDDLYAFDAVANAYDGQKRQIMALVQKDADTLSPQEQDYLELYQLVQDYSQMVRSLSAVLPNSLEIAPDVRQRLGLPEGELTYLDLLRVKDQLEDATKEAVKQYGDRFEDYPVDAQQAALLSFYLVNLEALGRTNQLLRIVPDFLGDATQWYAPWALLNGGHGSVQGADLLGDWRKLADAYYADDAAQWAALSQSIQAQTADVRAVTDWQLWLEVVYNQAQLAQWVMGIYALLACVLMARFWLPALPLRPVLVALVAGLCLHAVLLLMRIAILERPPVSTLYESILFVSFMTVAMGAWIGRHAVRSEGLMMACVLGAGLMAVSELFASPGDTMGVVMAVLNTNFWLATHVICITIGYGCALVVGSLAHLHLWKASACSVRQLQSAALVALLFTAVGTILGGIWADQSWGRFWGWDPKENGALAIVVWLVWVLHGRLTGYFKGVALAAALAFTNIIVALSWFGVNLLGVGLHSYGFTQGAVMGLAAFCALECVVIAGLFYRAKRGC